jgi:hypothetical protein
MVGEVYAGISSLKIAFDLAKGLKDIDDATRRNAAVIELQEKILSAQSAQSELVESVSELKKRVAELEAWDAEKQRYDLAQIAPGIVCYMLKPEMRSAEPTHRLCANCYAKGNKAFLQQHLSGPSLDRFKCNACGESFDVHKGSPSSSYVVQDTYDPFA